MRKVTFIEALVLVVMAVPAFAAVVCNGRDCLETKNVQLNSTLSADVIVGKIARINSLLIEIPEEIARDKIRYLDEKESRIIALKAERVTLRAQLAKMRTNGANITQNDFDGIIPVVTPEAPIVEGVTNEDPA